MKNFLREMVNNVLITYKWCIEMLKEEKLGMRILCTILMIIEIFLIPVKIVIVSVLVIFSKKFRNFAFTMLEDMKNDLGIES